ncbi:hypothetical protein E4U45_001998 [Claviceps purpurea]|nr:hypothetical protein E4U45_001998 [Claviceps purpurea]
MEEMEQKRKVPSETTQTSPCFDSSTTGTPGRTKEDDADGLLGQLCQTTNKSPRTPFPIGQRLQLGRRRAREVNILNKVTR